MTEKAAFWIALISAILIWRRIDTKNVREKDELNRRHIEKHRKPSGGYLGRHRSEFLDPMAFFLIVVPITGVLFMILNWFLVD